MTVTQKRLLVVVALCAALAIGGQALLSDHHERLADNISKRDAAHLFDCQGHGGPPSGIVITQGGQTLSLQRQNGHDGPTAWRIVAPLQVPADDALVEAFVTTACSQESLGEIRAKAHEPNLDLALFHLAPPKYLITLAWDGNSQATLAVGDVSGFNNKLYVRRSSAVDDGLPIEHIDDALSHPLQRDLNAWREKRPLVGVQAPDVARVDVALTAGPNYILTADGNGRYTVATGTTAPYGTVHADALKAREWLGAIVDARAEQFVADGPDDAARKRFNLTSPQARITLTLRDGGSRNLALGRLKLGQENYVFAQGFGANGPIVRLATSALWQKLEEGPKALEDMRVLQVAPSDVTAVTVAQGARATRYRRTDGTATTSQAWQLLLADSTVADAQVDAQKFTTALGHLLQMRAAHIVTRKATQAQLKQTELIVPKHTVTLCAQGDRPLAILWIGRHSGGQTLVTDDQKQTIWSVFEGTAETFTADPQFFLTAKSEAQ